MKKLLILVALLICPQLAHAQSQRNPCYNTTASPTTNCIGVGIATPLPVSNPSSFTRITTDTNTVVKASPGLFSGISVNTAGVTSSATVYNNTTCTGAIIGTFSTLAQVVLNVNAIATTGICVTTAGSTPADITILWQ
jgi:hypothetical protein